MYTFAVYITAINVIELSSVSSELRGFMAIYNSSLETTRNTATLEVATKAGNFELCLGNRYLVYQCCNHPLNPIVATLLRTI